MNESLNFENKVAYQSTIRAHQPRVTILKKEMNLNSRLIFLMFLLISANQLESQEKSIAFPGAEGYGKYTTGGRNGTVLIVSNLNNDGEGSFRKAAEAKFPRTIVFVVSGTIHLESSVMIRSNVTIAGQTSPGGICLADKSVQLGGDNIILRYMRFRMGDKYQRLAGMVDGSGGEDAFGGRGRNHIMIDHCSFSWSNDEVMSVYAGDSTTIQWCLMSEPLDYSYHFEKGDTDWEHHGYGGIWGGRHLTAHHNLFAHCNNRNPRFDGIRNAPEENVDFRNNVIYNWEKNSIYAGEGGLYNMVNNYYKFGPDTKEDVKFRIVNPGKWERPAIAFGKWYVAGNYVDGSRVVSTNNIQGVVMGNNGSEEDKEDAIVAIEHAFEPMNTESAEKAYKNVLKYVGASYERDTLDERIVTNVKNRSGRIIDVQGGYKHGTSFEETLNAWPVFNSYAALIDTDKDGLPDVWERQQGLDPQNPVDANSYKKNSTYTNIEMYVNQLLVKRKKTSH
jgi:hypothetical protein